MSKPSYLAFDLGASSSRAILGVLEDGRMIMEEVHRFTTPILEEDGHLYWDIERIWTELQVAFKKAIEQSPSLCSVSVDSWAVDYVPIDAQGNPLRNPYCYRDARSENIMELAFITMPAATLYSHTGIQFLPFNTLYQVLAGEDKEVKEKVHVYLTIADYFNFRFSGKAVIELSMASTTQMMDVRTGEWSDAIFDAYGIDKTRWPSIAKPGTWLNPVLESDSVISIASCSHDTGSAIAAIPVADQDEIWAYVSCGTWSLMGTERNSPLLSEAVQRAGFTHEAGLDGTLRFLKNLTGLWVLQECAREWGGVDWSDLESQARQAESVGVLVDLDDARFIARGEMENRLKAYFEERSWPFPESRAQLVRTLLESIAESYRKCMIELEEITGDTIQRLYMVGGGTQNALLCELTAQTLGIPVTAGPAEATALGNLLIQARTLGHLADGMSIRNVAAKSSKLRFYD